MSLRFNPPHENGSVAASMIGLRGPLFQKKLKELWKAYPRAKSPLADWYRTTRKARWECFADVRSTYGTVDQVAKFTVFDIGGNKFRLIVVIHFDKKRVYVRHVLTHKQYDSGGWKGD